MPYLQFIPNIILSAVLPAVCNSVASNAAGKHHKLPPTEDNKCELISTFSLLTQASLGLLCISCLIVKRFYEYPARRTWPVWCFDVLKQLIGAMGLHVCNVTLSILKGGGSGSGSDVGNGGIHRFDDSADGEDPCDWYFLNIVFDCTIGVFILYVIFEFVNKVLQEKCHFTQLETGQYGPDPHKPSRRAFAKQLAVYFGSLMLTKVVLYYIMEYFSTPLVWFTSHVLLIWLNEYPDEFEIFVVMFIVPIFMNCLQLILVDTIIQNQILLKENIVFSNAHKPHHHNDHVGSDLNGAPNVNNNETSTLGIKDDTYGTFNDV